MFRKLLEFFFAKKQQEPETVVVTSPEPVKMDPVVIKTEGTYIAQKTTETKDVVSKEPVPSVVPAKKAPAKKVAKPTEWQSVKSEEPKKKRAPRKPRAKKAPQQKTP